MVFTDEHLLERKTKQYYFMPICWPKITFLLSNPAIHRRKYFQVSGMMIYEKYPGGGHVSMEQSLTKGEAGDLGVGFWVFSFKDQEREDWHWSVNIPTGGQLIWGMTDGHVTKQVQ